MNWLNALWDRHKEGKHLRMSWLTNLICGLCLLRNTNPQISKGVRLNWPPRRLKTTPMYSVIQITWTQARSSRSKLVLRALISCNVCAWVRVWQRILLKFCAYANLWIYEYFRQEIKANNPFKVSSKYSYANIWCTKREELLTEKERNKLFESELDGTKFYLNIEIAHANPKPNRLVLGSLWLPPLLPPKT